MAIFFGGDKIQSSGYTPLTVYSAPGNPMPTSLKILQSFCQYKKDGNRLELIGAATLSSTETARGIIFDMLKLPSELVGSYSMDSTQSTVTGGISTGVSRLISNPKASLKNNILTLSNTIDDGALGIYFGAFVFHLFFTKS